MHRARVGGLRARGVGVNHGARASCRTMPAELRAVDGASRMRRGAAHALTTSATGHLKQYVAIAVAATRR